jgi:hypothetical protein
MNPLSHAKKAVETHPAKITAKEFLEMVAENPSVFEHWETPLEITEYVNCNNLPITHLSPHLTFSGKDKFGNSASFYQCKNLQIATGTFQGAVDFSDSGVKKIKNLNVGENKTRFSATFSSCPHLQTASGTYEGFVTFYKSGIHAIQNLHIKNSDKDGDYADFYECPNLKNLEGWNLSKKIIIEPDKLQTEKKHRAALQKFHKETQVEELPFL